MLTAFRRFTIFIGILFVMAALAACGSSTEKEATKLENLSAGPTPIVVRILNLDYVLTATPLPSPSSAPATPTPTESLAMQTVTQATGGETAQPEVPASSTPSCINQGDLVAHLSISPNSALKVGQYFAKVWRIRNTGDCTWDKTYALVFTDGERMESVESTQLAAPVGPGETTDLQINLVAPIFPGSYTANFLLQDSHGNRFGLGPDHTQPIQVVITVRPLPPDTPS